MLVCRMFVLMFLLCSENRCEQEQKEKLHKNLCR